MPNEKATLTNRDTLTPGAFVEPWADIMADTQARKEALGRESDMVRRFATYHGANFDRPGYETYMRRRRMAGRALGKLTEIPGAEGLAHFHNGQYTRDVNRLAMAIPGARDGFQVYGHLAHLHDLPANARLKRDRLLGGGMFAVEVWARAGSPFLLWIDEAGDFMVKPFGAYGWESRASWANVLEYFEPIDVLQLCRYEGVTPGTHGTAVYAGMCEGCAAR